MEHVLFYRDKRDNHDDDIKSIPKKKGGEDGKVSDDFKDWIHNTWTPAVSTYMHDRNVLMIWSDGSVIPGKDDDYLQVKGKPNLQKTRVSGAYVITRNDKLVLENSWMSRKCTSFDVEVHVELLLIHTLSYQAYLIWTYIVFCYATIRRLHSFR